LARSQHITRLLLVVGYENRNFFEKMTVFEKCRFSGKVSKTRFHIPLFGIVLIFSDIRVYIKKFKNYSTGFQAVTYPTLIVCKSISCVNFVDMKIFYTKRPDDKILLYSLCINTLQENPTFRTIRSRPPDRLKQQAARSTEAAGPGAIYNRYVNFCKKVVEKLARLETFL
jgi:hypothetical protein